jgi:DNA-binding protein YbaB
MQLPRYNLRRQHRVTILLDDAERQMLVDLMRAASKSASQVLREALQQRHAAAHGAQPPVAV